MSVEFGQRNNSLETIITCSFEICCFTLHEKVGLMYLHEVVLKDILSTNRWWQVPYFWAGLKMYDLVAGKKLVRSSYFVNKEKALDMFPMIKSENLHGAIIYYDGMLSSSLLHGVNYSEAIRIIKLSYYVHSIGVGDNG